MESRQMEWEDSVQDERGLRMLERGAGRETRFSKNILIIRQSRS